MNSNDVLESMLSVFLSYLCYRHRFWGAEVPWLVMCALSSLLGTLSVSCLAAESPLSCHLAQGLAPGGLDEFLLSWTVTLYVSQLWPSQHSALHFIQPLCIFLYMHFTSALGASCSEECHTGGELQDSGRAKPPRVVTYLLSSHVTSAECISYGFPSPVSRGCHSFVTCERLVLLRDTWHSWSLSQLLVGSALPSLSCAAEGMCSRKDFDLFFWKHLRLKFFLKLLTNFITWLISWLIKPTCTAVSFDLLCRV